MNLKNPIEKRTCTLALAAALILVSPATLALAQAGPVTYNSTAGLATQAADGNGHTVVVLQGGGDLPGVLTLVLSVAADGTLSGEWALNVSYTQVLHPNAQPNPNSSDPDSAQGETLIQKGTIQGAITAGTAILANGQITELANLQLAIAKGSMQFANTKQGSGVVNGIHIDNRTNSTATISLTF